MQKEIEKFKDSTLLEGMTSLRGLLEGQKAHCNDRKILHVYFDESRLSKIGKEVAFLRHEGERQGFDVIPRTGAQINAMATGNSHGGILAECSERHISSIADEPLQGYKFAVLLDGIEDPYNFGYAVRALYACGVDLLVLNPRNWLSAAGVVARASAGTSERIPALIAESTDSLALFRNAGYNIVCADADAERAVEDAALPYPLLLVIGGERRGISSAVAKQANETVRLAYDREFRGALSAASAAAILAYEIARKNREA